MELEELFLKKEEFPISDEICFMIPIHPKLLDKNISINPNLAKEIFPQVAEEWYKDLKKYFEEEKETFEHWKREQIEQVYLKEKPKIVENIGHQSLLGFWRDDIEIENNGFNSCFSISRNGGGSLYFREDDSNCKSYGVLYNNLSEEKRNEFVFESDPPKMYIYAQHNVDAYPEHSS